LNAIASLSERIVEYNERIENLAQQSYPQVALLKQIKGVGTLIALTYMLTLEDPHRFRKSRDVGGYLDCSRDEGTLGRANRKCTSAKKAIRIYERCWCRERNTSWGHSASTVICGAGA
jgi:transposase